MLTARGESRSSVRVTSGGRRLRGKPFSPRELVARIKIILRRGAWKTSKVKILSHEDLVLCGKYQVTLSGRPVPLTPHEFRLLHAFMAAPGRVFSRNELLTRLYPKHEAIVIDRVVDVHIGNLRQKIEKDPSHPRYIVTVRGIGYKFAESGSP
jgi:DNA-binding response OmpR family regulator